MVRVIVNLQGVKQASTRMKPAQNGQVSLTKVTNSI